MNFAEFQRADRRLVILRGLMSAAQYRANALLLRRYAESLGHIVSADVFAGDLQWLHEGGLIRLDRGPEVPIAELSERGLDVATGRAEHPGVQRPMPD